MCADRFGLRRAVLITLEILTQHLLSSFSTPGAQCLLPGKYKFTIFDKAKDGLCCAKGKGNYSAFIDGTKRFSSPLSSTTWAKRVHLFTIFPPSSSQQNSIICNASTERKVKVEIKTDKYGGENSWFLRDQTGRTIARNTKKYGSNETDTTEVCLKDGYSFDFIVLDDTGDGMVSSLWPVKSLPTHLQC